uniref:Uncharacterized protein n=2 Tax=Rhodnius prolixus TaxID=13249 RepID=T1HRP3_RHOPR
MLLINNEMPDEVKDVFSDVSEKATALVKVMEFQEWHRSRLMNYHRTIAQKYDAAKLYIKDLEIKFTTIQQKYESAKMKIKEQENVVQDLKRKLSSYKQKYGSCRTPVSTQPLVKLDFETSPFPGKTPMNSSTSLKHSKQAEDIFTPSYALYRNSNHPPFTPDSSGSVRSSIIGSMSSYSGRNRSLPGYTPPSKTMELLTLLNKS